MSYVNNKAPGRVKFEYWPDSSLLNLKECFDGVRNNVVQVGVACHAYEPKRMGILAKINTMAGNFDIEKFYANYRKPGSLYDFANERYKKWGTILGSWSLTTPQDLICRKPVKTVDDWKGLVIRGAGGQAEFAKALGASPTYMPSEEAYTAFQRGTIDGCIYSRDGIVAHKWYEVAPYWITVAVAIGGVQPIMNGKWFGELPDDLQKIMMEGWQELEKPYCKALLTKSEKYLADAEADPKIHLYRIPEDERERWFEKAKAVYDEHKQKYPEEWKEWVKVWRTVSKVSAGVQ
jgi:TRAP-type C4-dicarboxylate transport system substrate-binding protein